jgi:5-methylcytosine-specific restriction protein A
MGGMRRSLATNSLVLVSDHTKGIYDDRWEGNICYYTAMGLKGDQHLTSQNKTVN